jgi:hypothetical protein
VRYEWPWAYYIDYILWSNVCVIRGFGSIGFVTTCNHFQWFGYYKTNVISWCGPLEIGLDRATNVMYGMLYNGLEIGIVL